MKALNKLTQNKKKGYIIKDIDYERYTKLRQGMDPCGTEWWCAPSLWTPPLMASVHVPSMIAHVTETANVHPTQSQSDNKILLKHFLIYFSILF